MEHISSPVAKQFATRLPGDERSRRVSLRSLQDYQGSTMDLEGIYRGSGLQVSGLGGFVKKRA